MRATEGSSASSTSAEASASTNTAFSTSCTDATTSALGSSSNTRSRRSSWLVCTAFRALAAARPLRPVSATDGSTSRIMTRCGPVALASRSSSAWLSVSSTGLSSLRLSIESGTSRSTPRSGAAPAGIAANAVANAAMMTIKRRFIGPPLSLASGSDADSPFDRCPRRAARRLVTI